MLSAAAQLPDFIVHRFGAFVTRDDTTADALTRLSIDTTFALQIGEAVAVSLNDPASSYFAAKEQLLGAFQTFGPTSYAPSKLKLDRVDVEDDIANETRPEAGREKKVLAFPKLRFDIASDHFKARIAVKFSLTTCIVDRPDGRTKFWVSSEVVPMSGRNALSLEKLVTVLDKAAEAALRFVVKAIQSQVERMTDTSFQLKIGEDRIRLTFADDLDPSLAAYIDAIVLNGEEPSTAGTSVANTREAMLARNGRRRFEDFIGKIESKEVEYNNVGVMPMSFTANERRVVPELAQIAGVYMRNEFDAPRDARIVHVTGFSRHLGVSRIRYVPANFDAAEFLARGSSGARAVSAVMASRLGEEIEPMATRPPKALLRPKSKELSRD